ncbi:MAG: Hsp20/alpha crystallin family protein [Pseudomonadota bacterium]|nr:Hsp20/alpha crystallin family protein [Pseudomonadota bacterium]
MSVVRFDPWRSLSDMRSEMDRVFGGDFGLVSDDRSRVATGQWAPAMDIREENDAYVVLADLPGVNPDEIEITLEKGILNIQGERHIAEEPEQSGFRRFERPQGRFHRRFSLPDTIDSENVVANSRHGVLEVRIAKKPVVQPRRITVTS